MEAQHFRLASVYIFEWKLNITKYKVFYCWHKTKIRKKYLRPPSLDFDFYNILPANFYQLPDERISISSLGRPNCVVHAHAAVLANRLDKLCILVYIYIYIYIYTEGKKKRSVNIFGDLILFNRMFFSILIYPIPNVTSARSCDKVGHLFWLTIIAQHETNDVILYIHSVHKHRGNSFQRQKLQDEIKTEKIEFN